MRAIRGAVIGVVVLVATVAPGPVASANPGGASRPWKSSSSAAGTFNTDTADYVFDGTIIGTHIGKGTVHVVGNTANGTSAGTITAANGDMLFTAPDGPAIDLPSSVCPPDLPFASQTPGKFVGGTGRFAGATGRFTTLTCAGLGDGAPNASLKATLTGLGDISY